MGGWTGIWQWVIVLVIVLLLFGGRGKISQLMGDLGKGLKSFKKSMQNGESPSSSNDTLKSIDAETEVTASSRSSKSTEKVND